MNSDLPPNLVPEVLFEDEDLLVINKPANLLSVPDGYDPSLPHVRSVLAPFCDELWIVHRLDKGTSGAMVLAKNAEAHRALNEAFRERQLRKIYHGLAAPAPGWSEKLLELPLLVNADRRHRTRVHLKAGKPAWTRVTILRRFHLAALLEMEIRTGVTHQIRAHLRACDMALLGDELYRAGLPPCSFTPSRPMLHARELTFTHPKTGERQQFTAPYPEDFRATLTDLRHATLPDTEI